MQNINQDPKKFALAFTQERIECLSTGDWKVKNWFSRLICWSIDKEKTSALRLFMQQLMALEQTPIHFNENQDVMKRQSCCFKTWIEASKIITKLEIVNLSPKMERLLNRIKLSTIKLRYRIEAVNGGLDYEVELDSTLQEKLRELVLDWKKRHSFFGIHQQTLTNQDIRKITFMCRFPKCMKLLLNDKKNREKFFQYAFRDNLGINELCQFDEQIRILKRHNLIGRIGAFSPNVFEIWLKNFRHSQEPYQKTLSLMVEGKKIDMLDRDQLITFSNGKQKTLQKIFESFKYKDVKPGNFEFFFKGILPWNCEKWGDNHTFIDPTKEKFWEEFPPVNIISKKQIEERYQVKLNSNQWVSVLESTYESESLVPENSHGYLLFFIPYSDTFYKILPIGLYPKKYPSSFLDKITFATNTVEGVILFPDPNYYASHRGKASFLKQISPEIGATMLQEIGRKKTIGNVFMLAWENCSHFAQTIFLKSWDEERKIPNFFQMKFNKIEPQGTLAIIQKVYTLAPKFLKFYIIIAFHFIFRSKRSYLIEENGALIEKSAFATEFGKKLKVMMPGAMQRRIKEDKVFGTIHCGY